MTADFPFSAIIGQEVMQTAMLLCAVDPAIGGVLVRGHKGTAKSTAARSLAHVLPQIEVIPDCPYRCDPNDPQNQNSECQHQPDHNGLLQKNIIATPFVDLPLSTTEDRLVGTLHLEKTLRSGQRQFEPGLFATVNRGILYVDEVNLLPDHLVDMLLDTATSGVNRVEREGISSQHDSRFLLLGTMNPEEGELRPQFLDRFGLCVTTPGLEDISQRVEIVQRRLAFDLDPHKFCESYALQEEMLRQQITSARRSLHNISVPDAIINHAAEIAREAKTLGHRAELTLVRAARALTAMLDKKEVTKNELSEVTGMALAHRLPDQNVLSDNELKETISNLLERTIDSSQTKPNTTASPDHDVAILDNMNFPGSAAAGGMLFTYLKKKLKIASSAPTNRSTSAH